MTGNPTEGFTHKAAVWDRPPSEKAQHMPQLLDTIFLQDLTCLLSLHLAQDSRDLFTPRLFDD